MKEMSSAIDIFLRPTHHFYIIFSDTCSAKIVPTGAGLSVTETETFTIDNARRLTNIGLQRTKGGEMTKLVYVCGTITQPAQHALLKICEAPTAGTTIYFVVPRDFPVLLTLRSRCIAHTLPREVDAHNAKTYLQ